MDEVGKAKVSVRFQLQPADLLRGNLWWLSRKWSIVTIYIIMSVALIGGLASGIATGWRGTSPLHLLLFACFLVGIPLLTYVQVASTFRQLKPEQLQKTYGFSDNGFVVADGLARAEVSWGAVQRVVERKPAFYVFVQKQMFHVIPRRAFSSEDLVETRQLMANALGKAARLLADEPAEADKPGRRTSGCS